MHVEQHSDVAAVDRLGRGAVAQGVDWHHLVARATQAGPMRRAVLGAEVEGGDLHARAVVRFEQFRHQQPDRVRAQVAGEVADAQTRRRFTPQRRQPLVRE